MAHLAFHCKGDVPDDINHKWLVALAKKCRKNIYDDDDNYSFEIIYLFRQLKKLRKRNLNKTRIISHMNKLPKNELMKLIMHYLKHGIPWAIIDNPFLEIFYKY